MKKKLKRKVWTISTALLLIYLTILVLNPTIILTLLPIIIPTGLLTVGIPTYTIIKQTKETKEKISEQSIPNNNFENKKEIQDTIINDNQINEVLEVLSNNNEKPKIKTKGTIH